MNKYTVQIEAGNADQTIWQAVAPSEVAEGESAQDVAEATWANQTVADGDHWRVRVWDGEDVDTGVTPAAEVYNES